MSIIAPDRPNLTHTLCFMFSGKAGVGKTWSSDLAQKYCDELGLKTFKSPLAYGVKATATYMGWDGEKDAKGRKLLQDIGRAGRAYNKDMFISNSFSRVDEQVCYPFDAIFIDDWRFKNEYWYVANCQGLYKAVSIRIDAAERESLVGTPEYDDSSETELDHFNFDRVVNNSKDYTFYEEDIKRIIMEELKKVSVS